MSFPRYPAYKDSGVEWLGEVPAHWAIRPLKYTTALRSGGTPSKDNPEFWSGPIPWASAKDLKRERLDDTEDHLSPAAIEAGAAELVPAGSVLVVVRGMILARTFPVSIAMVSMAINQDLKALVPVDGVLPNYLARCLQAAEGESSRRIDEAGHGTKALRMDAWTSMPLPVPPKDEQQAIATFLDRETAKIDGLVAEQEKLIALLQEKRQAVISHAVSKGLGPDVPMKDSGVEWLGEVPAHWIVAPTGYRYEVQLGRMLNVDRADGLHLRPYLRVADVQWGEINTDDLPCMDFPPDAQVRYRLEPGDLLVNEGGSYVGRTAIWRGEVPECYYQKALHRLRVRDSRSDCAEFFLLLMQMATHKGVFIAYGNQTTIDHLTAEQLRRHRFGFPPLEEQRAIVEFVEDQDRAFKSLLEASEAVVRLLKERRAALISAAVTGQFDVRGLAEPAAATHEAAGAHTSSAPS